MIHLAEGGSNLLVDRSSVCQLHVRWLNVLIHIFDDSFALDYKTDATCGRRLKEVTQDATVPAQRVGTYHGC